MLASGATDIGRIRERNEDAFAIGDLDLGELFDGDTAIAATGRRGLFAIVCDGMGGAAGGEVASELAVRTTWREMREAHATDDPEVFARLVRRAVRSANQRVFTESEREASLRGMGTTLSAVGVCDGQLIAAQIGDSRAYLLRSGQLTQITRDQTLTQALLGAGRDPAEAAMAGGATILQALGVAADVDPSLSMVALRKGDRVLVCTDGLYNQLGDATLQAILDGRAGPGARARALCDAARASGGADNITAVVFDLDDDALPAAAGDDDQPRFVEFDPREEGERALTSTSHVARRLAAQAGIGLDPGPPIIPATGRHAVILRGRIPPGASLGALVSPSSPGFAWWKPIAVVVAIAIAAAVGWCSAG